MAVSNKPPLATPTTAEPSYSSDVAFTPSVKAIQSRKGSRRHAAKANIPAAAKVKRQVTDQLGGTEPI